MRDVLRRFGKPARRQLRIALQRAGKADERFDFELETLNSGGGSPLVRIFGLVDHSRRSGPWVFGVCADISNLRRLEPGVWHAMHHDRLTGLANRALFYQRLEATLADAKEAQNKVGVLLVDLDRLKEINARLGTSNGDQALRTVGQALA